MENYKFRVAWFDCDPAGIVFYPRFLAYMNEAAHGFFEDRGFPLAALAERGVIGIPMVSLKIDFRSPMVTGDWGEIETTILSMGRSSMVFNHRILAGERLVCECQETRVYASNRPDGPGITATTIHDDVRAALTGEA